MCATRKKGRHKGGSIVFLALGGKGLFRHGAALAKAIDSCRDADMVIVASARDALDCDEFLKALSIRARMILVDPHGLRGLCVALWRFANLVWRERPALIHDYGGPVVRYSWLFWVLGKMSSKVAITLHDPKEHSGMASTAARMRMRLCSWIADVVFVHGNFTAKQAVDAGINKNKVAIIPLMEMSNFQVVGRSSHDKQSFGNDYVLVFGDLRPNKGIELLPEIVQAAWALSRDTRFIIAGRIPPLGVVSRPERWHDRVQHVREVLCSDSRVTWMERFIPDADIYPLFNGAGLVLLPYVDATQSGVLMMAIGMGRAVLATDVGDISETIRDGETGWLVECDAQGIGRSVARVMSQPELRSRVAIAAKRYADANLSPTVVGRQTLDVYKEIMF